MFERFRRKTVTSALSTSDESTPTIDDGVVVHLKYECKGCGMTPIVGTRFKSTTTKKWNICHACEAAYKYPEAMEPFLKLKKAKDQYKSSGMKAMAMSTAESIKSIDVPKPSARTMGTTVGVAVGAAVGVAVGNPMIGTAVGKAVGDAAAGHWSDKTTVTKAKGTKKKKRSKKKKMDPEGDSPNESRSSECCENN
ncbi:Aste57867_14464 [Aphanomyces stellatus]|uniref:Aste57867_14464 protein n=1 Tax=Aphanomyces stellatus TaxID=120398 RepID=A0A485L0S7_9STRA|nr:hypothetical protein As57867_014410 [Aphanomyces stellatus]VFT91286.1 Aste57867_14464 [Aphanomyces stellatus]